MLGVVMTLKDPAWPPPRVMGEYAELGPFVWKRFPLDPIGGAKGAVPTCSGPSNTLVAPELFWWIAPAVSHHVSLPPLLIEKTEAPPWLKGKALFTAKIMASLVPYAITVDGSCCGLPRTRETLTT